MAHFTTFNGEIKKASEFIGVPTQADFTEFISGQIFCEKAGELFVEESFDLPVVSGGGPGANKTLKEWGEEGHWSVAVWAEETATAKEPQRPAEFKVTAGSTISFNAFTGAPYWRLRIKIPGAEDSKANRAFARAFERGRV